MNVFTETFLKEGKDALVTIFIFKIFACLAGIPILVLLTAAFKIQLFYYFYIIMLVGVSAYGAYKCIAEFKTVKHVVAMMVFGTMILIVGLAPTFGAIDLLGAIFPLFGIVTLIRILLLLFSMEAFLLILTKFFFEIIEFFRVKLKEKKIIGR